MNTFRRESGAQVMTIEETLDGKIDLTDLVTISKAFYKCNFQM
jgi:hypothetical protein